MKLNESRLAVAAELSKKLITLQTAARVGYSSLECLNMPYQQVKDDPAAAAARIRTLTEFLKLMRSVYFDCCDLASDLVESLEHGTKCVLIPEPEPMPTGSEAAPTDQKGGAAK